MLNNRRRLVIAVGLLLAVVSIASAILKWEAALDAAIILNFLVLHSIWIVPKFKNAGSTPDWSLFKKLLAIFSLSGLFSALIFPAALLASAPEEVLSYSRQNAIAR